MNRINLEDTKKDAEKLGLQFLTDDLRLLMPVFEEIEQLYAGLESLEEQPADLAAVAWRGQAPAADENRHNAWTWRAELPSTAAGPLDGKRVAIKDNICVAGLPMRNGSPLLADFVPTVDATVVERIRAAGGTIIGKVACEDLCLSGASHTGISGPVRNARLPSHSSGGSSSGSATVVALGEADIALGTDQGGSVRIPASWSGVYGLKPTFGLVPYTGIFPIEMTLDHCGPIAGSVADLAACLAAVAGPDPLDPRQRDVQVDDYVGALSPPDIAGMRIGLVSEGFGHPVSEAEVDRIVRAAADRFAALGAVVTELSIPLHRTGLPIWAIILMEGSTDLLVTGGALGSNWAGRYMAELNQQIVAGLAADPAGLAATAKLNLLVTEHVRRHHGRSYYARAQNLRPRLRQAYDEALAEVDLLLMPTVPFCATPLPPSGCGIDVTVGRARDGIDTNTSLFDATGHPALSFPCGQVDGLPVGAMLIGRHWGEARLLKAAHAFEQSTDWQRL